MSIDPPWLTPKPAMPQRRQGWAGRGFIEPAPWAWDGGVRREPILDADCDPPRVVRRVGWRRCMSCRTPFFSEDVAGLRLCDKCKLPYRDQRKPTR